MSNDDPRANDVPHDPAWELEPRWSAADRERLAKARAKLEEERAKVGPGLAAVRSSEDESESKTG